MSEIRKKYCITWKNKLRFFPRNLRLMYRARGRLELFFTVKTYCVRAFQQSVIYFLAAAVRHVVSVIPKYRWINMSN
jgi:hypothetical protein